jgi:hypothetical protein
MKHLSRRRPALVMAALVTVLVLLAACGSGTGGETSVELIDDEPVESPDELSGALARASELSFATGETGTTRITAAGVASRVDVRYFEPVHLGPWTAPDECAFNTEIEVELDDVQTLASPPFEGPRATTDLGTTGLLGTLLPVTVPTTGEPGLVALVVAFGHDQVLTVSAEDATAPGALDSQPLDGWTSLAILVPGDDDTTSVDVTVTKEDIGGEGASGSVTLPRHDPGEGLAVLTDEWLFDESLVGEQCEPPAGDYGPSNQLAPPETDLFNTPIGQKPTLPPPGEQPVDVPGSTAAVLDSIRMVYDISNLYDEAKIDHVENPTLALVIFREARANRVVEPYLSQLDPEFDSVAFASPTEAAVLYRVGPGYHWEIGRVVFADGAWRVALGTLCRDLSDAVYTCPGVAPDPRPGPLG